MLRYPGANPEDRANLKNNLGIVLDKKKRYKDALKYLKAGLRFARNQGDIESLSESFNNIGIVYDNLGHFTKALKNFKESIRLKELIGHTYGIGQTFHNLGLAYERIKDFDNAIKWYNKSLSVKRALTKDLHGIAQTESNLSRIYFEKEMLQRARKFAIKSLQVLRQRKDSFGIAEGAENLAKIELKLKKYSAANVAVNEAITAFASLKLANDTVRCRRLKRTITNQKIS